MRKYNCPVILVEDTVEEPMRFDSLMSAAHYLYDSDMSPRKPTKVSIYTALLYAVKHNNRYKNYTVRLDKTPQVKDVLNTLPNSNGVQVCLSTNYLREEDVTIIWQHVNIEKCDFSQRSLVGWYYGEPDDEATEKFSLMPMTAQLF